MSTPRQAVAPNTYVKYVYPHGQVAGVVMPPQPPGNMPQPNSGNDFGNYNAHPSPMGSGGGGGASAQGDDVYGSGGLYGGGHNGVGGGIDIYGTQPANHAPLLDTNTSTAFPDI